MASLTHVIGHGDKATYYAINHTVKPGAGSPDRTDVMLVQFLVAQFFALNSYAGPEKALFIPLFLAATKDGKRWDDGIYGPNTRKGVSLFEDAINASDTSGIVRPGGFWTILDTPVVKIDWLNWVFDRGLSSDDGEKQRILRKAGNPVLAARLYERL
jgi:hypothetical protein